eukprot:scaffold52_cov183-Cylindrotheca_fusiformis.AAC.3
MKRHHHGPPQGIRRQRNEALATSSSRLSISSSGDGSKSRPGRTTRRRLAVVLVCMIADCFLFYAVVHMGKYDSSCQEYSPEGLNLIRNSELDYHDFFSDSWLLNKDTFLNLDIERINTVEDACFVAIHKKGEVYPTSRMFVDWTDLMVEHMSKWWVMLRTLEDPDPGMFRQTLSILRTYLQRVAQISDEETSQTSPLRGTIAIIAFSPYQSAFGKQAEKEKQVRGSILTSHSLAASIASLYKVGFGRVVVVGYALDDEEHVDRTFQLLGAVFRKTQPIQPSNAKVHSKHHIGDTDLAYVRIVDKSWVRTKDLEKNMPRGAVVGLQQALLGKMSDPLQVQDWLGTTYAASKWQYVYLTEPDTILHTKPWLLSSIRDGLDRGLSFFPHRLQPLPHESDLTSTRHNSTKSLVSEVNAGLFIPSHVYPFSNVTSLNPGNGKEFCCDAGKSWPGRNESLLPCGTYWWACGFDDTIHQRNLSAADVLERHKRLINYPLMRLKDGTGVVFGSSNQGRSCKPSKTRNVVITCIFQSILYLTWGSKTTQRGQQQQQRTFIEYSNYYSPVDTHQRNGRISGIVHGRLDGN